MNKNDVAIIGIGFRIPSCGDGTPNDLWNQLLYGFDGVIENDRWSENFYNSGEIATNTAGLLSMEELKLFDPLFFGIVPSEIKILCCELRLLLKCTWEALQDAKIDPLKLRGSNTSVFVGNSTIDYQAININRNETHPNVLASASSSLSNRISYCFDLHGESLTIDTACSSSSNAIRLAYQSIKEGRSNVSIACGSNIILDVHTSKSFSHLNVISKNGKCKSFDADGDGYVRSESVGVVVMKNLEQALKDGNNIYCVINGAHSNVDGSGHNDKSNFFSPSSISQSECIKLAIKSTNGLINENDIDYVEAHGTGTPIGDPIELEGISMALNTSDNSSGRSSSNPLLIGSIKSNIGHSEACSGLVSTIKCCLMFKNQCLVPNLHFYTPNPRIKFDEWNLKVVTDSIPFSEIKKPLNRPISIAINNFGITGSNTCLILSQFKQDSEFTSSSKDLDQKKQYLIPFSANSIKSLNKYQTLIKSSEIEFNEFVKHQIESRSTGLIQRLVVSASNWKEFNDISNQIKTANEKLSSNMLISANKKNATMVFVFCGQGAQYTTMGKQLYENDLTFKKSMDLIDNKLSKYYGYSILEKLRSIDKNDIRSVNEQEIAQPSTCMIQISLFELYKHWGITPSFIVGHSLGEFSASYCSGMIDLDTLCYLIYNRSMEQRRTNGLGKILVININETEFKSKYSPSYPSVEIACYNSPTSIAISGKESDLLEISSDLNENNVFTAMLPALSSFHSSSQLIIKDEILKLTFESQSPTIPIFSTVTTNLFDNNTLKFNSEYIFENIVKPVKLEQTISKLYRHIESNKLGSDVIFIEISPHPTLYLYLKELIPKNNEYFNNVTISVYSPLSRKKSNDLNEIHQTISKIYCQGYNGINFKCQLSDNGNQVSTTTINGLPLYQWDEQEYWRVDSFYQNYQNEGPPVDHLGNSNSSLSPNIKSFQTFIDISKPPFQWLKGHMVRGKFFFAGCGYINNILKLYASRSSNKVNPLPDVRIDHIEFKAPLILIDGINQCLQTNVYSIGKKQFKVLFHYKNQESKEWILTCNANLQLFNNTSVDDDDFGDFQIKYNIEEIISNQCNLTKLSKEELYAQIKVKTGICYSDSFQRVQECYIGLDCSLSIVSLHAPKDQPPESSFFNTSILDSFLHSMVGLIEEQCQIVFDRAEGVTYYSSRIPVDRNQYSHIYVYSKSNPRIGDSYSASITVMLLDGTVLFEIENAISKSITPIKDSLSIEYPTNSLYSIVLQPKDSPIQTPSSFDNLYQQDQFIPKKLENLPELCFFVSYSLYSNIVKRCPEITIDQIYSMDINELALKYFKHSTIVRKRLFRFVFDMIKQYYKVDIDLNVETIKETLDILTKSTRIMAKLLFPLENEDLSIDLPLSLYENGLLDKYFANHVGTQTQLVSEIVKESVRQLINEKIVFRILEFGGGIGSLSELVLDKINSLLLEYPNYQIDIEYTWSDVSPAFIKDVKIKYLKYSERINIIYKSLDLENPLIGDDNQGLNTSYFDYIIMSNVLHVIKDIKYGVDQIYNLLTPNGHLLFVEPSYNSVITNSVFSVFDQWWSFSDSEIRTDSCCMKQETWIQLLKDCNFNPDIKVSFEYVCLVIQAQKPSILESPPHLISTTYDQIIIYGDNNNFLKSFKNQQLKLISNIKQFDELKITNQSVIYFTKCIDQLSINNFKEITFEYIQINQKLLKLNSSCKHVLITCNSQSSNYLASSLVGAARYFDEFPQLQLFTLNFDSCSIENENLISKIIGPLTNKSTNLQREFTIKNHKVYYDRFKCESKIKNTFKVSNSFEQINQDVDTEKFKISLSPNLEYQLESRSKIVLKKGQVEIQVFATGLNYKDYLTYAGLLPSEMVNHKGDVNKPEFGCEFSGIITTIGENCNDFKVGDQVYGISYNTTASHIIADINYIERKPSNITHVQASSIPAVYVTSYHSLYNIGVLDNQESILIHASSGGIGLSTLEILKWKGHTGLIFVTVGSKEKEQYLKDNYGKMITGIYSTRNKNYVDQIKLKIKQLKLESDGGGIDLILNTLSSSDYMDSNFKCLNSGGRIVDLTITHLNSNEFTENKKFKYNYGYHNVETVFISKKIIKKILKKLVYEIENGNLKTIPFVEYSIENVKDAIEFLNTRNHIGKIVINHQVNQETIKNNLIENQKQLNQLHYTLKKPDYQIQPSVLGKNILVTGQRGIVLEIIKWILRYSVSVENIIILTKSKLKWELEALINKTKRKIKFHFKSVDIGDSELVDSSISQVLNENPEIENIDSIFHFAFTQIACEVDEISMHHLDVSHTKTFGAINLHNQSIKRGWKLINFVMASSITSILGSSQQGTYVSANSVLDSFSKYRVSIGLPSTCCNYGLFESVGFVSRHESIAAFLNSSGLEPISTNTILGTLDLQLQNPKESTNITLFDLNNQAFLNYFKNRKSMTSKFDFTFNMVEQNEKSKVFKVGQGGFEVSEIIVNKISETLSIDPLKLNQDIRLIDYGADSLVIIQFKSFLDKEFSISNSKITIQQIQIKTISEIIRLVEIEIDKKNLELQNKMVKNDSISSSPIEFWENEMKIDDLFLFKETLASSTLASSPLTDDKRIMITGATGYLGIYLLSHFIKLSNCSTVYCLIRNKSKSINTMDEIINNFKYHQLYDQLVQDNLSKIRVVVGDLSKDKFGISKDQYFKLSSKVNLIINSGAEMNLSTDYQVSKLVNVNGLKEIIKLSISSQPPIRIVNFSTIGVFLNHKLLSDSQEEFDEKSIFPLIENIDKLGRGYNQSKVVGEYILMKASESFKIPSMIIRPPAIFSNPHTGIGSKNDVTQLLIQSCYDVGHYPPPPYSTNMLMSSITWVANNSINLILNEDCWSSSSSYTIYNVHGETQAMSLQRLSDFKCKEIKYEDWKQLVLDSNHKSCKILRTLHSLDDSNFELDKGVSISKNTKSLLQSMGSYGNDDDEYNTWKITNKMIKNHINSWNINKYK